MDSVTALQEHQRLIATTIIEKKVMKLAKSAGATVTSCRWHLGRGINRLGPHRLNVDIEGLQVAIYFTESDLVAYLKDASDNPGDLRLRALFNNMGGHELTLPSPRRPDGFTALNAKSIWAQGSHNHLAMRKTLN